MSSTLSFKPDQQFHFNQQPVVEYEINQDDTVGNKFDGLEKRLILLENTLDSKP